LDCWRFGGLKFQTPKSPTALAGQCLATLAEGQAAAVPTDSRRVKGWAGQLIEAYLGATAGSLSGIASLLP